MTYVGAGVSGSRLPILELSGSLVGCHEWQWKARWVHRFSSLWATGIVHVLAVEVTGQLYGS